MIRESLALGMLAALACAATSEPSERPAAVGSDADVLCSIAREIQRSKRDFPQLAQFSAREHCDRDRLVISYGYHTHRATGRGGWSSAVPNPDADGVWFHLDFHDPASTAQIHTQPVVPDRRFRDKQVMLLVLEGDDTKPLAATLERIMKDHGVTSPR